MKKLTVIFVVLIFILMSCESGEKPLREEDKDQTDNEVEDYDGEIIYDGDIIVEKLWTKQWGTRLEDSPIYISDIRNDKIYISSTTYGKMSDTVYYNGDALIQIMDKKGNVLEDRQWGTVEWDSLSDILITGDGTIFSTVDKWPGRRRHLRADRPGIHDGVRGDAPY